MGISISKKPSIYSIVKGMEKCDYCGQEIRSLGDHLVSERVCYDQYMTIQRETRKILLDKHRKERNYVAYKCIIL